MKELIRKQKLQERRAHRVRAKVRGTGERPRLSVFRSNRYIYVQLIDDEAGVTIAAANSQSTQGDNAAEQVGTDIAKKALAKGIKQAVFDRSSYAYTGKIKQLADAARAAGLEF